MAGSFLNSQYREVRPARAEMLADGRKRLTRYVSFKQNSEFPAEMGGAVPTTTDAATNWASPPTGWENLYLISATTDTSLSPNGSGNNPVTILTFEQSGTTSDTTETRNNGALLIRTIRSVHTAPATPDGYTKIRDQDDNPNGFDVFTYTFAKGVGEIGQQVSYAQSDDAGTTGATVTTIRYIVAGEGTVQPTTLSGSVKIGEDYTDQDGYRIWTTTWAKGTGLVSQLISARQDGLREVTNISLGTRVAPDGVVIRDDYRIVEGFKVYTVSTIQEADGGSDPTDAEVEFERYVPFTYPGRAKTFQETVNTYIMLDVFLSPPVTTDVKATITVTYTTTATIGTVANYWNPSEWATLRAAWVGWGDKPYNQVTALTGYRSVSATAIEVTASVVGDGSDVSCLGNPVFGGEKAKVWCTGGPADPGTNTYTLDVTLEPAFVSTAGTVYYRKTVVTATIPAQASLPV
jgi:hypothetical protein